MGSRNSQVQRVKAQGHEGMMGVTLEEINEAIENRPLPDWVVAQRMLPLQPGEFTVVDLARQTGVSNATARAWLARWVEEGRLTRVKRRRQDGRRVWAYAEGGSSNG